MRLTILNIILYVFYEVVVLFIRVLESGRYHHFGQLVQIPSPAPPLREGVNQREVLSLLLLRLRGVKGATVSVRSELPSLCGISLWVDVIVVFPFAAMFCRSILLLPKHLYSAVILLGGGGVPQR